MAASQPPEADGRVPTLAFSIREGNYSAAPERHRVISGPSRACSSPTSAIPLLARSRPCGPGFFNVRNGMTSRLLGLPLVGAGRLYGNHWFSVQAGACTETTSFPYTPSGRNPTHPKISLNQPASPSNRACTEKGSFPYRSSLTVGLVQDLI